MKLGSLFDGIGTFSLSGLKFGFIPVWASEIESFPIAVTKHHFPDMKHLGDITKTNGAEIEPVDVITFGSPCQDMSVAGKREGLAGERSGLFMEAVRIIREQRTATNGQCPRFAVWENVPGAFSSNSGQDFRTVLEEITETEIPMPASGKWAEAGMVRTESVDIAWRTLDAQYWGVPQRRKRIFLVADFRGQCAGEILFIEQGLSGHPAESGEARQEAAGDAGTSVTTAVGIDAYNFAETGEIAACFNANSGGSPTHSGPMIMQSIRINCTPDGITGAVSSKWAKGTGAPAGDECYNLVIEPQLYDMTHADEVMRPVQEGLSPTLNSRMGTGGNQVPVMLAFGPGGQHEVSHAIRSQPSKADKPDSTTYVIQNATRGKSQNGLGISQNDVSYTLDSLGNHAVCIQGSMIGRADKNGPQGDGVNEEVSFTLNTIDRHAVATRYAVRRLTPLECERLQGLPDGWTNIVGAKDTQRYKAIGNGIAKPCSDFVLGGIARVMKEVGEIG